MPKRESAAVPSVREQMRERLNNNYGWCRANQHLWQPPRQNGNSKLTVHRGVVRVEYTCGNCDSKRIDECSLRTGELITRRMIYPKGYIMQVAPTGEARPLKQDWRREHFQALVGRTR